MPTTRPPQGWEHQLGLGVEAMFGAPVGASTWFDARSAIEVDQGLKAIDVAIGERDTTHYSETGKKVEGNLTTSVIPGRVTEIAALLQMLDATHQKSATVQEIQSPEFARQHVGCTADTWKFSCEVGAEGYGLLTAEFGMVGSDSGDQASPGTPNYSGLLAPFTSGEMQLVIDSGALTFKRRITVSGKHNLQKDRWEDGVRADLPVGPRELDVDVDIDFDDDYLRGLEVNRTEFEFTAVWVRGANDFGFYFPRCIITRGANPAQAQRNERVRLTPKIKPLRSTDGTPAAYVQVDGVQTEL